MSKASEQPAINKDQFEAYRKQRAEACRECGEKLAALLAEYDCDLATSPSLLINGQPISIILVSK